MTNQEPRHLVAYKPEVPPHLPSSELSSVRRAFGHLALKWCPKTTLEKLTIHEVSWMFHTHHGELTRPVHETAEGVNPVPAIDPDALPRAIDTVVDQVIGRTLTTTLGYVAALDAGRWARTDPVFEQVS